MWAPLKFDAAIKFFAGKGVITREKWDKLTERQRLRAFMVSHVANADIVHDVHRALDRALQNGSTLDEFKEDVGRSLRQAWGGQVKAPGSRLITVWRTNIQSAYVRGRWEQQQTHESRALRPYLMFDAILDGATTVGCETADGVVLPRDHPWWRRNHPLRHHRCRSGTRALRPEQAREQKKFDQPAPDIDAAEGFGSPPDTEWRPDVSKYPLPVSVELQRQLLAGPRPRKPTKPS